MELAYSAKECRTFDPTIHIPGVGINAQLSASRFAKGNHTGFITSTGELQRGQVKRIRHLLRDTRHELRRDKWLCADRNFHVIEFRVKCAGYLVLKDQHRTRQTDSGDDKSHRDGKPQVYFCEELFHKANIVTKTNVPIKPTSKGTRTFHRWNHKREGCQVTDERDLR